MGGRCADHIGQRIAIGVGGVHLAIDWLVLGRGDRIGPARRIVIDWCHLDRDQVLIAATLAIADHIAELIGAVEISVWRIDVSAIRVDGDRAMLGRGDTRAVGHRIALGIGGHRQVARDGLVFRRGHRGVGRYWSGIARRHGRDGDGQCAGIGACAIGDCVVHRVCTAELSWWCVGVATICSDHNRATLGGSEAASYS